MNGVHRDYSQLSVDEKRELRKLNDELSNRLTAAHHSLESLKLVGKHNDDPEHASRLLSDIHTAVTFTDLGPMAGSKKKRVGASSSSGNNATSQLKAILNLEEHAKMVDATTKHRSDGQQQTFHVDPSVPLPLSFEAKREKIQQQHSNAAQSVYSGLFRQNAGLNPHVEQGPVPDIYTPLPTSRRQAVAAAKQHELSKHVSTFTRSKEYIAKPPNPPQLFGKKVASGFVPSCATQQQQQQSSARDGVAERHAASQGKIVGDRPFR